jgi:hypothetical protein
MIDLQDFSAKKKYDKIFKFSHKNVFTIYFFIKKYKYTINIKKVIIFNNLKKI